MSTDADLTALAAAMVATAPHPADVGTCSRCWRRLPCRRWPTGDRPCWLCAGCWTTKARGKVTAKLHGRRFEVFSTHPQHGELYRGWLCSTGLDGGRMVWQLHDPDHHVDTFSGDFEAALARLLDMSPGLDQIDPTPAVV
jgi:hypothetical protein